MLRKCGSLMMSVIHLCFSLTFFLSGLLINCVQLLLFIVIQPFSPRSFKKINYYLHYSLSSMVLFVAEWWSGSDCRLHVRPDQLPFLGREHALLVMNHTYEVDWLMGWVIADRFGVLGAAKVFVKDVLRFVPVVGWSWCFSNVIFLKRNWAQDQEHVNEQLAILGDYPDPVWLLLFCEGTRFTEAKHAASMKVARDKGLAELRYMLLPRTRGFIHSVSRLGGQFGAVYDLTIDFNTKDYAAPTLTNMMWGRRLQADIHVRRIPMSEMPTGQADLGQFLHQLYQRKDRMIHNYRCSQGARWFNGRTPLHGEVHGGVTSARRDGEEVNNSGVGIDRGHSQRNDDENDDDGSVMVCPKRRAYSLLNTLFWATVILTPLCCQLPRLMLPDSNNWPHLAIFAVIIGLMFFGFNKMINLTKISKGSQYGHVTNEKTD